MWRQLFFASLFLPLVMIPYSPWFLLFYVFFAISNFFKYKWRKQVEGVVDYSNTFGDAQVISRADDLFQQYKGYIQVSRSNVYRETVESLHKISIEYGKSRNRLHSYRESLGFASQGNYEIARDAIIGFDESKEDYYKALTEVYAIFFVMAHDVYMEYGGSFQEDGGHLESYEADELNTKINAICDAMKEYDPSVHGLRESYLADLSHNMSGLGGERVTFPEEVKEVVRANAEVLKS